MQCGAPKLKHAHHCKYAATMGIYDGDTFDPIYFTKATKPVDFQWMCPFWNKQILLFLPLLEGVMWTFSRTIETLSAKTTIMHILKNCPLLLFLFVVFACGNDKPEASPDFSIIQGRWELLEAYRNNRPIESLVGTFYDFTPNKATTNLTPSSQAMEFDYHFRNNTLQLTHNSKSFMDFEIDSLNTDFLEMQSVIRGYKFRLVLTKVPKDTLLQ